MIIKIPIVFSTDHNYVMQTGVCITSLLINSNSDEYYDIFILCSEDVSESDKQQLQNMSQKYGHCHFNFIDLSNYFNDAFEIRNITKAAYYRLIIPVLIPQYSKIIYSDVDIVFLKGLSNVYNEDITDYYLAAVLSGGAIFEKTYNQYVRSLNLNADKYVQSGFLIMNSSKMIEDNICSKFHLYSAKKFLFLDQDIINIVCENKIKFLPLKYNYTQGCFHRLFTNKNMLLRRFSEAEISETLNESVVIHYEGPNKPWNSYCFRYDIWWEYYRKSIFFDAQFYNEND
ncbi:MAG: glycosyltransferase family 8 protein [Prevotellaceae bacterium]|nr:glycosyltransferase family 8 protein [Prevotellaceae bacterium]